MLGQDKPSALNPCWHAGEKRDVMIGGKLVTEGAVDSIVEVVCQLWLYLQK